MSTEIKNKITETNVSEKMNIQQNIFFKETENFERTTTTQKTKKQITTLNKLTLSEDSTINLTPNMNSLSKLKFDFNNSESFIKKSNNSDKLESKQGKKFTTNIILK